MRRPSPLAKTEEEVSTLLGTVKDATDIFEVATYEACEKILNDTLGDTEVTTTSETTRYSNNANTNTTTTTTTDKGMEAVADIESAFDDLLA